MIGNDSFVNLPVIDSWDETRTLRALVLDGAQVAAQHQSPGQVIKVKGGPGEGYFALANRARLRASGAAGAARRHCR